MDITAWLRGLGLVDSTMLASSLDPEELGEVIGVYHRSVADVVGRFDGFLAKYLGDGVLARRYLANVG